MLHRDAFIGRFILHLIKTQVNMQKQNSTTLDFCHLALIRALMIPNRIGSAGMERRH